MHAIRHQLHQPRFGSTVGAGLGMVIAAFLYFSIFGQPFEHGSFDLPFMLFRKPARRDNPVIIKLDDASYDTLKQNPYSFNGTNHANLLRRLKKEGAAPVVFDIVFLDQNPPPPGDADFAAAIKEHGKVVLAGTPLEENVEGGGAISRPPPIRESIAGAAAGWGDPRASAREGAHWREHPPGTDQFPSLTWKAGQVAGAAVTQQEQARFRRRWLNFYGPRPFAEVSYSDAVDPNFKFPMPLSGRAVFVGRVENTGYAGAQRDQFASPWTRLNGTYPFGVEFHALAYANLVNRDWLSRVPSSVQFAMLLAVGGGLGYALPKFRPLWATGIAAGSAVLLAIIGCVLQLEGNIWFDWMTPVTAQIPLVLGWSILFNSIRSYFEREFLNRSLELYLSPAQVKQILKQPDLLKPGVEQREVSILFTDIANFSKISERMVPEDLAKLLNDYYETTIGSVHKMGGTVMNLIGDAILAIWNAPQPQPTHRDEACRAAVLLAENLISFDASRQNLRLRTRVGLHTGLASVGNIGSSTHFDYAVLGENVNLASRLEGLNKYLGTSILATREIQKSVEGKMRSRFVGHFRFKGLDQVVEVHELLLAESASLPAEWLNEFGQGIHCFQRAAFPAAENHFKNVLQIRPGDGPSEFYLAKIRDFASTPPKGEWMGEIDLSEK